MYSRYEHYCCSDYHSCHQIAPSPAIKHLSFSPLSLCMDLSIDIIGQDVDDSDPVKEKEKLVDNWVLMT